MGHPEWRGHTQFSLKKCMKTVGYFGMIPFVSNFSDHPKGSWQGHTLFNTSAGQVDLLVAIINDTNLYGIISYINELSLVLNADVRKLN